MTTYTPVGEGFALCLHPNQTSSVRPSPPHRVRERRKTGPRRWVLRTFTVPGRPVLGVACPDCPARAVYITEAARTPMAPWLVKNPAAAVGAVLDTLVRGHEADLMQQLSRPSLFRDGLHAERLREADCYEASWGWVHVKPGCRCIRSRNRSAV